MQFEEYRDQNNVGSSACLCEDKNNKKFQDHHPEKWLKSLKWEEVIYERLQQ